MKGKPGAQKANTRDIGHLLPSLSRMIWLIVSNHVSIFPPPLYLATAYTLSSSRLDLNTEHGVQQPVPYVFTGG